MTAATLALAFTMGACGDDVAKPAYNGGNKKPSTENENNSGNKEDETNKEDEKENAKAKNHVFICFGQSNMEGNAAIQDKDKTVDPRFKCYVAYAGTYDGKAYKVGDVRTATPPLCRAGQSGGIGVTDYFGRTMVKNLPEDETVSVIVVALGGTSIKGFLADLKDDYINTAAEWLQGYFQCYDNDPYARLIEVAEKAKENGKIEAILMHQGESDWDQGSVWPGQVKTVYDNIVKDLDIDEVPFLVGQTTGGMDMITNLPKTIKTCHVISNAGCPGDDANNNGIHFNHEGYEKMGEHYANEMLKIMGIDVE